MKVTNNTLQFINAQHNEKKVKKDIEKIANPETIKELAGLFLSDSLEMSADTASQEIANFHDAIGFSQIADGALKGMSKDLAQIKALQTRANNAAMNSDNLEAINSQIAKLSENINKSLSNTTYNGKSVFGNFEFNGVKLNSSLPKFSLDNIDDFEKALKSAQSDVGALQNSLNDNIDNLDNFITNTVNAMPHQDLAKNVMDLKKDELNLNASTITSAHQNTLYSKVTTLLS